MQELWVTFLLSLVVYRVTRFLISDSLIEGSRNKLERFLLNPEKHVALWKDKLHELMFCPYCLSIHVAWIAVVVTMQWVSIPLPVMGWLAISGASMVWWRIVEVEED